MRANVLEKYDYVQDNVVAAESAEAKRLRIAHEVEAACKDSTDFEEFLGQYGVATISDFA